MSDIDSAVQFEELLAKADKLLAEDSRTAFSQVQELLERAEATAEPVLVNKTKELLARCYQANGNYHKALQICLEALPWFESQEDYAMAAKCLNTLGAAYNYLGEFENRLQTNLTCLSYRRKGGDEPGEISTLSNIGDSYNSLGQHEKALEYFNLCLQFSALTDRTKTIVIHNIGETEYFLGNYEEAQDKFAEAVELARKTSYYIIEEVAFVFLAKVHLHNGNCLTALECLDAAETIAREKNFIGDIPGIIELRAKVAEKQGDFQKSLNYYKEFIRLNDEIRKQNDTRAMQDMQFAYRVDKLQEENRQHKEKNREIRQAYLKIAQQHRVIEEKNRSITDSINYALKIQSALVPSDERMQRLIPESFVFYKPRDIVSGDFYCIEEWGKEIILAAIDCTGHGVPGAFMSFMAYNLFQEAVMEHGVTQPAAVLARMRNGVRRLLDRKNEGMYDGMDVAVCTISADRKQLTYSGAQRPLWMFRDSQLYEFKETKCSVSPAEHDQLEFISHTIEVHPGDVFYIFTDGYADQFGGPKGKKFKISRLKQLISDFHKSPIDYQLNRYLGAFAHWQGPHEQVDDVLLIGFKVPQS